MTRAEEIAAMDQRIRAAGVETRVCPHCSAPGEYWDGRTLRHKCGRTVSVHDTLTGLWSGEPFVQCPTVTPEAAR